MAKEERLRLRVEGMTCAGCASKVEKSLARLPGLRDVRANALAGRVDVAFTPSAEVSAPEIRRRIDDLGFRVVEDAVADDRTGRLVPAGQLATTVASAVFVAVGWLAGWLIGEPLAIGCYVAAVLTGGAVPYRRAVAALRQRVLDMNLLMVVAVLGALALGEWLEGAMVIFLFGLAELLETYTVGRSRRSIESMMDLAPGSARVRDADGTERVVEPEAVDPGQIVIVAAGERIPIDGLVRVGQGEVDQAPITGESQPVDKGPGAEVFAGTMLAGGYLEVEATRSASETTLARIVHLVQEARSSRAPSQRFVERFARVYTPLVLVAAVAVAVLGPLVLGGPFGGRGGWLYRSLVLLVVSCPCALVISTPVTILTALGRAAGQGILVKGGVHLESLGRLRALAFDKTGTITYGHPRVTEVEPAEGWDVDRLLRLAVEVEARSSHHLGRAILDRASCGRVRSECEGDFEALAGRGVALARGSWRGLVGNLDFLASEGFAVEGLRARADELAGGGTTVLCVGERDGERRQLAGLIGIRDAVREGARDAVQALREQGVRSIVMLTGDRAATAISVAAAVGIDEVAAELLPEQKVDAIQGLLDRHGVAAMVGDGVNDAPALAAATVGIAMATAGTDVALETADVALMADDLSRLPEAVALGRQAVRLVQQNIFISLFLKALFLALAVAGVATLWMAILADTGASLLVTINGMRAGFGRRPVDRSQARRAGAVLTNG